MKIEDSFQKLVTRLYVAFLLWLFGILILIPLNHSWSNYVSFIILIPISMLFICSIKDIKLFSEYAGKFLCERRKKTKVEPYIQFCYACWIIVSIIFFAPFLYYINSVIGGIFLFGSILCILLIVFLNFKYFALFILNMCDHVN